MTKKEKKPNEMTLFFATREECEHAKHILGQTRRKCIELDKAGPGSYSKQTGHYGLKTTADGTYRVAISFKLTVDAEAFQLLTWEQKLALKHVDGDSSAWIVS